MAVTILATRPYGGIAIEYLYLGDRVAVVSPFYTRHIPVLPGEDPLLAAERDWQTKYEVRQGI